MVCRRRQCLKKTGLTVSFLCASSAFMALYTIKSLGSLHQPWTHDKHLKHPDKSVITSFPHHPYRQQHPSRLHVVTGFFKGALQLGPNGSYYSENLTLEELNHNNFQPQPQAGAMGKPYAMPTGREQIAAMRFFRINQFNLIVSDRIPLDRTLPDVRKSACKEHRYPKLTLTTSIVIVFHNEAWSTLMRTVTSVVNRSDKRLLQEIILVDDFSNRTFLRQPLEGALKRLLVPIRIRRSNKRIGLIRARLLGAEEASGDILTFLDSHCEVTNGWLEPIVARIMQNRHAVVCPVIDVINDDTFAYQRGVEAFRGGFNWNLLFRWYSIPTHLRTSNPLTPIATPVMAGGLFAIRRDYFYKLGTYDPNMDIWGGENLELSFRAWLCGGRVEILPCSHVGHIFRHASPHDMPHGKTEGDILFVNTVRVAEVWMDQWKELYYSLNPKAAKHRHKVNVTSRLMLREQLQCKDFCWYLNNVWPDHFLPLLGEFFGQLRLSQSAGQYCLEVAQVAGLPGNSGGGMRKVSVGKCQLGLQSRQLWIITKEGRIKTDEHLCLQTTQIGHSWIVQLLQCGHTIRELWTVSPTNNNGYHLKTGIPSQCLQAPAMAKLEDNEKVNLTNPPIMTKCAPIKDQIWIKHEIKWHMKK